MRRFTIFGTVKMGDAPGKEKIKASNKIAKAERLARKRDNARSRELYRQACGLK